MSEIGKEEVSFERMIERTLLKYRRLFPDNPVYYRGAEVVNYRTHKLGEVQSMSMNELTLEHSDGSKSVVPIDDVFPSEKYWGLATAVTMACISYKNKDTPAVLVSEGTFLLPCPVIFEKYANILAIPDRDRLRGVSKERYYEHFRKFLVKISWDDMTPKQINNLSDNDIDLLIYGKTSKDEVTDREITLPPEITLEKVIARIQEVYTIKPCAACTVPKTCDCRMRIVQQITGDKASSYKVAQHTFRHSAELMSFLLKGIFRGRPRIRLIDYDVWLQERLDANYDPRWVEVTLRAIQLYESWAGKGVSDEVRTTLKETASLMGIDGFSESEEEIEIDEIVAEDVEETEPDEMDMEEEIIQE